MGLGDKYNEAWRTIIAPPRFKYDKAMLGPQFHIRDNHKIQMDEFKVTNSDGLQIEGNVYFPTQVESTNFVIYLHTRGGCRLEGLFLEKVMLPKMGLVLFDFAGSGYSEGEYITLGAKEALDVKLVIYYLRQNYKVDRIVLWGRSMGAVAAILFAQEEDNQSLISGLILDSPFSSFKRTVHDVVTSRVKVPTCIINCLLYFLMRTVKRKTGVSLVDINPIKFVDKIHIPGFFMVCKEDVIAKPDKVKDLYVKYGCKMKEFHLSPGEHQTSRDNKVIVAAIYFMLKCFDAEKAQPNKYYVDSDEREFHVNNA